ncbi:MAG TPA: hypothetical protein VFJ85_17570 [Acidimicrobiales bacterium]|nr:hypothetical protein [Acidimicrobiales bacterium]
MRKALAALGVAAALTAGAGAVAYASSGTTGQGTNGGMMGPTPMMSMSGAGMDAMHDQMRASMPADVAAACDAAHDSMTSTASTTSTSTGSMPMDHAAHHR